MQEEDKDFFVLVLGVLAAILLVISWWYTTGGIPSPSTITVSGVAEDHGTSGDDDHGDDDQGDDDQGDEPESESEDGNHDQDNGDDGADAEGPDNAAADPESSADAEGPDDASADPESSADEGDSPPSPLAASVFDAVADRSELGVITGLLRDAGLDEVLASDGPFTLLAPSDDAVSDAAGSDTTVTVLETARTDVLRYHVIEGTYTIEDLTDVVRGSRSTQLTTLQGETVSLSIAGNDVIVNGNALISGDSTITENGIVHVLDNVLVPPVAALNTLVAQDPILFAPGSAAIQPESFPTLDRFIEVLSNSETDVTIEGHTDSSGDPILNQNLSQSRARSVLNYLVANGIEESRLTAIGFGSSKPVADNNTEEGRALNRRIEFSLG